MHIGTVMAHGAPPPQLPQRIRFARQHRNQQWDTSASVVICFLFVFCVRKWVFCFVFDIRFAFRLLRYLFVLCCIHILLLFCFMFALFAWVDHICFVLWRLPCQAKFVCVLCLLMP